MRAQYLSDLHFEFHADAGESFVASLDPTDVNVLIIAGDLAVGAGIGPALDRFCKHYAEAQVLYVHGNHEFYGSTREQVVDITNAARSRHSNLHWLDGDDAVVFQGHRFLGAPLWFRHPGRADALKGAMNDFRQIRDFESWVYEENARALAFFDRELRKDDIVITHYLPSESSISPQWKGDPLNPFFVCDVESLIRARQPAIWVHGHTHDSVDALVGDTRVVCNPFGYARHELNSKFEDRATFERQNPSR